MRDLPPDLALALVTVILFGVAVTIMLKRAGEEEWARVQEQAQIERFWQLVAEASGRAAAVGNTFAELSAGMEQAAQRLAAVMQVFRDDVTHRLESQWKYEAGQDVPDE